MDTVSFHQFKSTLDNLMKMSENEKFIIFGEKIAIIVSFDHTDKFIQGYHIRFHLSHDLQLLVFFVELSR